MNAITWVNVALHALILSALGWLLVKVCVKDARHRAWASLIAVGAVIVAPLLMELEWPTLPSLRTEESVPTGQPSSWKPDWTISTSSVPRTHRVLSVKNEPSEASPLSVELIASWICAVWAAGAAIMFLRHAAQSAMIYKWRRSLRRLSTEEGKILPSCPESSSLRVFEGQGSPCVVGLWRPVIAVPQCIIASRDARHWRWLLSHEGEHVRGRDTSVAWLLGWIRACLWWNPFVQVLIEEWSQAREEICDHAAVGTPESGAAAAYSSFLLDIASEARLHSPAMLHMAASRPARRLRARMTAMLTMRRIRKTASSSFLLGTVIMMASFAAVVSCIGVKAEDLPARESQALITRTYKVAPDFLNNGAGKGMTTKEILASRGLPFPEGASAVFIASTSQLIVRNTKANLDRLEDEISLIKWENANRHHQIYISSKWVDIDTTQMPGKQGLAGMEIGNFIEDGRILTDSQLQVVMRALAQMKGIHLMVAPSVTTKIGQRATVEVLREFFTKEVSTAIARGDAKVNPDLVGPSTDLLAQLKEGKIQIEIGATLGCLDDRDKANPQVKYLRKSKTVALHDQETVVLRMGEEPTKPGHEILLFVTPAFIDTTGKLVEEPQAVEPALKAEAHAEREKNRDSGAAGNIDELFLKGYIAWKKGSDQASLGNKEEARKKLEDACQILWEVSEQDPSWQKEIVAFRLKKIGEALTSLGFALPPKANHEAPSPPPIPITIEVKTVELRHGSNTDFLTLLTQDIQGLSAPKQDEATLTPSEKPNETLLGGSLPPGLFSVAGVFTSTQYASVMQKLSLRKDATTTAYPVAEGMNGKSVIIPQKEEDQRLFSTTVEPVVGEDGYTIDLNIQISDHRFPASARQTSVTTSITLWDGQTVALGGLVRDDPKEKLSRIVFITVKKDEAEKK